MQVMVTLSVVAANVSVVLIATPPMSASNDPTWQSSKKDGVRELFDRHKLFAAIHRSVGKFLTSDMEIEELVSQVEDELYALGESEVTSRQVGDLVLEQLARRNEVAYVRFASVYREFKSVEEFEEALKKLRELRSS
jgi:transcriptional repressor NrdR